MNLFYLIRKFTFVRPPYSLHSVPMKCHSRQFTERFSYVEVTQRRYFEAGHFVLARIALSRLCGDLSFKRQM